MVTADGKTAIDNPVAKRLRVDAATAFDLYSQIKQAHWTVVGPNFIALHELFDQQATAMRGHVDSLAERVRILGGIPEGTLRHASNLSALPDMPVRELPSEEAVRILADAFETFAEHAKSSQEEAANAGDAVTEDIYIQLLRDLNLQAWFLRSHLGS